MPDKTSTPTKKDEMILDIARKLTRGAMPDDLQRLSEQVILHAVDENDEKGSTHEG